MDAIVESSLMVRIRLVVVRSVSVSIAIAIAMLLSSTTREFLVFVWSSIVAFGFLSVSCFLRIGFEACSGYISMN